MRYYTSHLPISPAISAQWQHHGDLFMLDWIMLFIEISFVIVLTLINGLLAMSELAIISSRTVRLKVLQEQGVHGARRALKLAAEPGRFLSPVQIGITLVGILSGAFSGATLGDRLALWFISCGLPENLAYIAGVGLVVTVITYLSLILGELVPKQIALSAPEKVACKVAPFMEILSTLTLPLVWVLDFSGRAVLRITGTDKQAAAKVTEEEVHTLLAEAEHSGVLETGEKHMIHRIMRLGDKPVRSVMTPRILVDTLNLADKTPKNMAILTESVHSRYPVYNKTIDNMLGVIWAKDLLNVTDFSAANLQKLVRPAPVIPSNIDALDAVEILKKSPVHMGLVYDEHGTFEGIVTAADILEAIVGDFATSIATDEDPVVARADGSLLLAGWLQTEDLHTALNWPLPGTKASYQTLAGLMIEQFQRIPNVAESITYQGWRFEIVDRDGNRIDKVLATKA